MAGCTAADRANNHCKGRQHFLRLHRHVPAVGPAADQLHHDLQPGHTYYALACLLTPDVPSNEGCFGPVKVTAPQGSIINCTFPASVGSRVNTGWYIHSAVFKAMSEVLAGKIQAGNGLMSLLRTYGSEAGGEVFTPTYSVEEGGERPAPAMAWVRTCSPAAPPTYRSRCLS